MAELLVMARDRTSADPEKDRRGCYKRGYVVLIREDGNLWGGDEGLPNFVVIKLPGVPREELIDLTEEQDEDDSGVLRQSEGIHRRRRWKLFLDNLPAAAKAKLAETGELTITKRQLRSYIKRIRDNTSYEGLK